MSCLNATAVALVSLSASKVLLPTPHERARKRVDAGLKEVPSERRELIRTIDEKGEVMDTVREYLRPLHEQASKWPETAFVDFSLQSMYHLTLGCKYKASTVSAGLDTVLSFIPFIDPSVFTGEARYRLSEICSVYAAFDTYKVDNLDLVAQTLDANSRKTLNKILFSSDYRRLISSVGLLGYVKNPAVVLRRVGKAVKKLVKRDDFRFIVRAGTSASEIAGHSIEPLTRLLNSTRKSEDYSPPLLELPITTEYKIYRESIASADLKAAPLDGSIFSFEHSVTGGHSWLNVGEEHKIVYDVNDSLEYKRNLMQQVRKSLHRL